MEFIIGMDCYPFIDQTRLPKQIVEQAASVINTYGKPKFDHSLAVSVAFHGV